ncbi:MAG: hypothetical protein EX285_06225 [Thaumarchaeota archaeon]|nr:hypothetical protein [Nitrososphaerota archaeon]
MAMICKTVSMACLTILLASNILYSLSISQQTYGYPSSIDQSWPVKWEYLNFTICIDNGADTKYEQLFIKAIEDWKNAWPHFRYTLIDLEGIKACEINVTILKQSVDMQNAGHAGVTWLKSYGDLYIGSVEITIPTQTRAEVNEGIHCCREIVFESSEKFFYETALHEFGHALNLGHAVDNNKEPVDIMYSESNERAKHVISALSIKTLDKIYTTSTQAKDYPIIIQPSVTINAITDKSIYVFDEILELSGKVSWKGGTGTILLFDPEISLYTFISFTPKRDGSFSLDINLKTEHVGTWILVVQYSGASEFIAFEVKEIPYKAYGQTDKTTYVIGDVVKINGNITRHVNKLSLVVINPDGIVFTNSIASLTKDKQFNAEFTLRDTRFTIDGVWTIRFELELVDYTIYFDTATDVYFDVRKAIISTTPDQVEHEQNEPKLKVRVQAKQIRDIIIIRVRNLDSSSVDVYTFEILSDFQFIASKGSKGWIKEVSGNKVTFVTFEKPIYTGDKQYFLIKVDRERPLINWKVNESVEGSVIPFLR